ncbi:hypothetical protein BS78_02G170100 [Paspalum vaginatum]|nr:hypothetical protein BS78_02G170100 [Paspalum vaginatum]
MAPAAGGLKMMAAICCIMLILTTTGQLMAADASSSPHLGSRHLMQLEERAAATNKQPGFKNALVRNTAKPPATRVRINGPPN